MNQDNAERGKRSLRSRLFLIATNIVSLVCLYLVLRGSDLPRIWGELQHLSWWWVALAVVGDIGVYVWHGYRWRLVLKPVTDTSPWDCIRAIYVGLFANEVLPLRSGEVIRCFLLARWADLPISVSLASALIERIFDGIWLCIFLVITIQFVHLPKPMVDGGVILAIVVFLCGALLAVAMFYKQQAKISFENHRILSKLNVLIEDLHLIGHSRYLYYSALASLPYLLLQIIPIWAISIAYPGFDLSIGQAAALMVMLRLGAVVPQAPGNLGLFQLIAVQGLMIFGVHSGMARRFSFILWAIVTLPLLLVGFVALAITGMRMGDIHHEAHTSVRNRSNGAVSD
jgi:uncharacterized protein (TIRG00374 family)